MVGRGFSFAPFIRDHPLGCALGVAGFFWGFDALLHAVEGGEGFMENLFSTHAHSIATKLFVAVLILSLGLLLRAEHLQRRSEAMVRASERRFRTLAGSAPVGIFESDTAGRWVYVNEVASVFLGLPAPECLREGYAKVLHEEDRVRVLQRWDEATRLGRPFREECRFSRRTGEVVWAVCEARALFGEEGHVTGFIGTITNITDRKSLEERLQTAAFTDDLTGLFNRRGFFTLAGKQVEISLRSGAAVGLVYLDVNRFKQINDRWGHKEGDRALLDVADVLRETFRKSDILGRIGGDEFVVFFSEAGDAATQRVVLSNLRQKLADHNAHAVRPFTLELSAGVAFSAPGAPCSLEELLTRADRGMYQEKRLARERLRSYGKPARPSQPPRLTPRTPLQGVAAEVSPGGPAEVVDISLGGACLRTSVPLQIRNRYGLHLSAGATSSLNLSAEVIWARELGVEPPEGVRYLSGLRFDDAAGKLGGLASETIAGNC